MRADSTIALLDSLRSGNDQALGHVMERVHDDLRKQARFFLQRHSQNHTLQPDSLLSELYLKLSKKNSHDYKDRKRFLAYTASAFLHIVIDEVRKRNKRQQNHIRIGVTTANLSSLLGESAPTELETVATMFDRLKNVNPEGYCIVSLYAFSGLTLEEIAKQIGRSPKTVSKKLTLAKSWLCVELSNHRSVE